MYIITEEKLESSTLHAKMLLGINDKTAPHFYSYIVKKKKTHIH